MFKRNPVVPEIRILPMNKSEEFDNESIDRVQQEFFEDELSSRHDGKYHYRNSGLRSPKNSLILFQYDNRIVASAQLKDIEKFNVSVQGKYKGAYYFYKDTIEVFDPITFEGLQSVCPNVKEFKRTKQIIGQQPPPIEAGAWGSV